MKKLIKFIFIKCLLVMALFLSKTMYSQLPPNNPLYDSVFVENFNAGILDTSKWFTFHGWGQPFADDTLRCWSNNTLFYVASVDYDPFDTTNRTINGGTCKLIARKENNIANIWTYPFDCTSGACLGYNCFNNGPTPQTSNCFRPVPHNYKYSTAMLRTKRKFKYGFFEMKFKFPGWTASSYNAFHPSFWLYDANTNIEWSELDIFEIKGDSGYVTNAIHMDATFDNITQPHSVDPFPTNVWAPGGLGINLAQWHTMSCMWRPDSISFYVDNTFIRASKRDTNQYLLPMPILVENTINQFFDCLSVDSVNTQFPFTYEIDYVKVWQPKLDCSNDKVYCNVNQSSYESKIYKSVTIGGSGCSATFNNSINSIVGVDYVLLNEGFEVGSNMELIMNTEPCWTDMENSKTSNNPIVPMQGFDTNELHNPQ